MLTNFFVGFLSNGSICDLQRVYLWQVWVLAQLVEIFSNDGALSQKAEGLLVQSVPIPVGCALAHLHMHSISNHQLQAKSIVKQDAQIQLQRKIHNQKKATLHSPICREDALGWDFCCCDGICK